MFLKVYVKKFKINGYIFAHNITTVSAHTHTPHVRDAVNNKLAVTRWRNRA